MSARGRSLNEDPSAPVESVVVPSAAADDAASKSSIYIYFYFYV